jgi:hypothetical protein
LLGLRSRLSLAVWRFRRLGRVRAGARGLRKGRIKVGRTTPYINQYGALGLWLLSIEHDDNPWVSSGLRIAEAAKTQWVAALPAKKQSSYRLLVAEKDFGEPEWPNLNLVGWLKLAFPEEMRINSPDHPIAKALRGA